MGDKLLFINLSFTDSYFAVQNQFGRIQMMLLKHTIAQEKSRHSVLSIVLESSVQFISSCGLIWLPTKDSETFEMKIVLPKLVILHVTNPIKKQYFFVFELCILSLLKQYRKNTQMLPIKAVFREPHIFL